MLEYTFEFDNSDFLFAQIASKANAILQGVPGQVFLGVLEVWLMTSQGFKDFQHFRHLFILVSKIAYRWLLPIGNLFSRQEELIGITRDY